MDCSVAAAVSMIAVDCAGTDVIATDWVDSAALYLE
jgi:hypothetical protein